MESKHAIYITNYSVLVNVAKSLALRHEEEKYTGPSL
jgi:hypothetical protein